MKTCCFRATVENHPDVDQELLPSIHVLIAKNDVDFIIRISDRGGGIPHRHLPFVTNYHYTTASISHPTTGDDKEQGYMDDFISMANPGVTRGPMAG